VKKSVNSPHGENLDHDWLVLNYPAGMSNNRDQIHSVKVTHYNIIIVLLQDSWQQIYSGG